MDNKKAFKKILINNLKKSNWKGSESEFSNDIFVIQKEITIKNKFVWYLYENQGIFKMPICNVCDIISPLRFFILRKIYVKYSLKNQVKIEKKNYINNNIDAFFSRNKGLKRDSKISEIFD